MRLREGKRLYNAYNCVGCHAQGGGAIGPALMDSIWIYGSQPQQIYSDIVQGRPNGMPSFGGKLPDYQVWELVAYVRSMSGQLPSDVAPSRSDQMPVAKAEQARQKEHPCGREPAAHPEGEAMILMAAVPGFLSNQTSLNPAGPAAAHIEHTFALIFWITGNGLLPHARRAGVLRLATDGTRSSDDARASAHHGCE